MNNVRSARTLTVGQVQCCVNFLPSSVKTVRPPVFQIYLIITCSYSCFRNPLAFYVYSRILSLRRQMSRALLRQALTLKQVIRTCRERNMSSGTGADRYGGDGPGSATGPFGGQVGQQSHPFPY